MALALRFVLLLAAVMPLFAATSFHPVWWQTLLAAALGSALGQLAVRFTRGRRVAAWAVMIAAAIVAIAASTWSLVRTPRRQATGPTINFLVVTPAAHATLTWDDVHAMQTTIPSIHLAVPYLQKRAQLVVEDTAWNTMVVGTTPDYFDLRSLHLASGSAFDADSSAKVVVLGDTVVRQLYGNGKNPVGDTVRIDHIPFEVIGVLAHQGTSEMGQDFDDVAIVPLQTYGQKLAPQLRFGGSVLVLPESQSEMARVEAELRSLLRVRHLLGEGTDDDFVIHAPPAAN